MSAVSRLGHVKLDKQLRTKRTTAPRCLWCRRRAFIRPPPWANNSSRPTTLSKGSCDAQNFRYLLSIFFFTPKGLADPVSAPRLTRRTHPIHAISDISNADKEVTACLFYAEGTLIGPSCLMLGSRILCPKPFSHHLFAAPSTQLQQDSSV